MTARVSEKGKKKMDEPGILTKLGIGLSRALRYSYGGFLLIAFASVMATSLAQEIRVALSWQLVALTAVVIGTGIYSIHRTVVVPFHHLILCGLWRIWDCVNKKSERETMNPVRWLGSLKVPQWLRISAYTALRRSEVFQNEKEEWDLVHAKTGMVLMTAEAFLIAGVCAHYQESPNVNPCWFFLICSVLLLFSFFGFGQHVVECLLFKKEEKRVKEELMKLGFIKVPDSLASEGKNHCD